MKDISTRYTIKYILLYHEFVHLCISDEFWQGTCLIFKYTVYTISHAQSIFNMLSIISSKRILSAKLFHYLKYMYTLDFWKMILVLMYIK